MQETMSGFVSLSPEGPEGTWSRRRARRHCRAWLHAPCCSMLLLFLRLLLLLLLHVAPCCSMLPAPLLPATSGPRAGESDPGCTTTAVRGSSQLVASRLITLCRSILLVISTPYAGAKRERGPPQHQSRGVSSGVPHDGKTMRSTPRRPSPPTMPWLLRGHTPHTLTHTRPVQGVPELRMRVR